MRKTFRRIAALAVFAAMTVALIPNAFAATNAYLLIDDVKVNRENVIDLSTGKTNDELKAALAESVTFGSYNDNTNTFTIKGIASSMPYIRPNLYDAGYTGQTFNYGPYLPLTVRLAFYDGAFKPMNAAGSVIKVDGKTYTLSAPTVVNLTKAKIAMLLAGYAGTDAFVNYSAVVANAGVQAGTSLDGLAAVSVWLDHGNDNNPATDTQLPVALTNITALQTVIPDGTTPANAKLLLTQELMKSARYTAMAADATISTDATAFSYLLDIINDIATAGADALKGNDTIAGRYALMQKAMANKLISLMAGGASAAAFDPTFVTIPVYHYLYNDMYGENLTHTITYTIGGNTYTRRFTVLLGSINADDAFYAVEATKSLAADAINKDNLYVYAANSAVYFDFAQKDVLATNTWRNPATAYKLWDRSNFNLYGGWVSFKDTVLQGDTVFLDANVLLKNKKGDVIPAGTKLTLTFSKQQLDANGNPIFGSSYQYTNQYTFTVAANNTLPIWLALDKADMNWLYNTHNQQYVNVSFANSDASIAGSFMIYTRAVDRLETGAVNVDCGSRITLKVGETKNITASFANNKAMSTETVWASSNAAAATVSATGAMTATVTGVAVGSSVVTVKGNKDSNTTSIIVDVVSDTPTEVVKTYKVVTASSSLNVRSGMGTSFSIIGKLKKGTTFQGIASADGDWVKMTYVNQTGYVSAKYVIVID